MAKEFKWLIGSQLPRKGPPLIHGEVHAVADYSAAVVDEWVKSGVAEWVEEKSKKKEKD